MGKGWVGGVVAVRGTCGRAQREKSKGSRKSTLGR